MHAQTSEGFLGLHTKYQPLKAALAEAQAQQAALQAARRHASLLHHDPVCCICNHWPESWHGSLHTHLEASSGLGDRN